MTKEVYAIVQTYSYERVERTSIERVFADEDDALEEIVYMFAYLRDHYGDKVSGCSTDFTLVGRNGIISRYRLTKANLTF